jgi:hypothetical protein
MRVLHLRTGWPVWLLAPALAFSQSHTPQFKDYPVAERYTGRQVPPKLTPGTDAWYFRTRIREAALGKPNFAGHYILTMWGCGMECLSSAIIDVKTGAVYFIPFTNCCWYSSAAIEGAADIGPLNFRLNSRLVVFAGLLNEEGSNGPHYFKIERGKLIALR